MNKIKMKLKWLLYPSVLFALIFTTVGYLDINVSGKSYYTCCTFGEECFGLGKGGSDMVCCVPYGSQTNCSPSKHNYCKSTC